MKGDQEIEMAQPMDGEDRLPEDRRRALLQLMAMRFNWVARDPPRMKCRQGEKVKCLIFMLALAGAAGVWIGWMIGSCAGMDKQ